MSFHDAWLGDMSGQALQAPGFPIELLAMARKASLSRAKKRLMRRSHGLVRSPVGPPIKEEVREELHSAGAHNLEHVKSMSEQEHAV